MCHACHAAKTNAEVRNDDHHHLPTLQATTEWYTIPEAGLERCPNCFTGTRPITKAEPTTKKASPKTKGKA